MRKILLTTALVLPLSGLAFAQTSDTATMPATDAETPATTTEAPVDQMPAETTDMATDAPEANMDMEPAPAEPGTDAMGESPEAAMDEAPTDGAMDAGMDTENAEAAAADAEAAALAAEMASSDKIAQQQASNELRLDWVTGASVTSPDGQSIGNVNDAIVDAETGQMIAAIIGVGGFLGIGEKQIAVPWDHLTVNYDAQEITTELTKEEAEAAPEYVFREREPAPAPVPAAATAPAADPAAEPAMPAEPAN